VGVANLVGDEDLSAATPHAVQSYQDLIVWQRGMDLAESCYRITSQFPRHEIYGLTAQIRRAASSIPANVAEGVGRENTGSFIQHLRISQGSLKELETHLILAQRVGLLEENSLKPLLGACETLGKMLRALIRSLQARRES
jgi:four helix bundle protein